MSAVSCDMNENNLTQPFVGRATYGDTWARYITREPRTKNIVLAN